MSEKIPEKNTPVPIANPARSRSLCRIVRFLRKTNLPLRFFKVSNHEEAEDITADVFLKAWNFINEHKEIKSFSGLLYRVARNCIIDVYRARASQPELLSKDEVGAVEQSDGGRWYAGLSVQIENQKVVQGLKN